MADCAVGRAVGVLVDAVADGAIAGLGVRIGVFVNEVARPPVVADEIVAVDVVDEAVAVVVDPVVRDFVRVSPDAGNEIRVVKIDRAVEDRNHHRALARGDRPARRSLEQVPDPGLVDEHGIVGKDRGRRLAGLRLRSLLRNMQRRVGLGEAHQRAGIQLTQRDAQRTALHTHAVHAAQGEDLEGT